MPGQTTPGPRPRQSSSGHQGPPDTSVAKKIKGIRPTDNPTLATQTWKSVKSFVISLWWSALNRRADLFLSLFFIFVFFRSGCLSVTKCLVFHAWIMAKSSTPVSPGFSCFLKAPVLSSSHNSRHTAPPVTGRKTHTSQPSAYFSCKSNRSSSDLFPKITKYVFSHYKLLRLKIYLIK